LDQLAADVGGSKGRRRWRNERAGKGEREISEGRSFNEREKERRERREGGGT